MLSEGLCVHDADPPTRHAFEADAIARYLDWAPSYARAVDDTLRANLEWARH